MYACNRNLIPDPSGEIDPALDFRLTARSMMMESLLLPGCPGAAVTTSDGLRDPRLLPPGDGPASSASFCNFSRASCGILGVVVVVWEIVVTYALDVASLIV